MQLLSPVQSRLGEKILQEYDRPALLPQLQSMMRNSIRAHFFGFLLHL